MQLERILWTNIVPLRSNDPAVGVLLPQSVEAHKVLDNGDGAQQRSADTEDGIGRQLVSRQAVPHAKVHANGHENAVDEDEEPEPEDGLLAGAQRVAQRWRAAEVGVIVCDLGVWVDCVRVGRGCATVCCAGDGGGCRASRVSLVVVAGAVDLNIWHLQCVCLARAVCSGWTFGRCCGVHICVWPQWLCRGLRGGHAG